jgi:predicted kinase
MKQVILTKGLSGSGKTTWAKEFLAENPNTVIVCKDDIRASMGAVVGDNSKRVKENKVLGKRDEKIMDALKRGLNVIVADTNLNSLHQKNIKALVFPKYRGIYEFVIKDFTDVPVEVCIERCASRPEGKDFWKKVIMEQKARFLSAKKLYTHHKYYLGTNPKCVIFDLDGTLAIMPEEDGKRVGRSPFDDARCFEDLPNYPMVDIAKMYANREDVTVICLSGRDEGRAREATANWLESHGIAFDHLYMRKSGDSRKDSIIKKELFDEHIRGKYLVYAVFDDRPQVCRDLWVEEGLPLFQFGNPYHEF